MYKKQLNDTFDGLVAKEHKLAYSLFEKANSKLLGVQVQLDTKQIDLQNDLNKFIVSANSKFKSLFEKNISVFDLV